MRRYLYIVIVAAIFTGCIPSHPRQNNAVYKETSHNPKLAITHNNKNSRVPVIDSYSEQDAKLINYRGYTVSYNKKNKIPNWVCYELLASETDGPYSRKGKDFRQDTTLKLPQANDNDYKKSGWSRGHLAPAGDFKWSDEAMWDTFFYTNCCPQDIQLNQGQWETLEEKVRGWAKIFGRVYIVTGPIIGNNINGTIGNNNVIVPDAFFKAIRTEDQAIAFVMYNHNNNANLQKCAMSIDALERATGLDFFSELSDETENIIEGTYLLSKHPTKCIL